MSATFTYAVSAFPNANVTPVTLNNECLAALGEAPSTLLDASNCVLIFTDTTPTQGAVDAVVAAHEGYGDALYQAKIAKNKAIEHRTDELVAQGFQFPPSTGGWYGLSQASQTSLLALYNLRNEVYITYPVRYNSQDDSQAYDLTDATDVENFFLTAVGTCRAYLDSGTALKDEVRNATTIAEVEAIVDPR